MAKTNNYSYSVKDYFKYMRKCWYVVLIMLILGCAGGYYFGFKKDATTYSSTAKVIFYNNKAELNEANAVYNQFIPLISSQKVYEDLGYDVEEYDFEGVSIGAVKPGVYTITAASDTPEHGTQTIDFIIKHASEVVKKTYGESSGYEVLVTSMPSGAIEGITKKDRIVSFTVIVVFATTIAFAGLFVRFNMIAKK